MPWIEFDPAKDKANTRKHGVSLAEGDGVLMDPLAVTIEDPASTGEGRWVTVGSNTWGRLMVVVWTERRGRIRLISVRAATRSERQTYEKGI